MRVNVSFFNCVVGFIRLHLFPDLSDSYLHFMHFNTVPHIFLSDWLTYGSHTRQGGGAACDSGEKRH